MCKKATAAHWRSLGALSILLLCACAPGPAVPTPGPAVTSTSAAPIQATVSAAQPVLPVSPPIASIPVTQADQVKPQPADARLVRGAVFLDAADIRAAPDRPDTALVTIKGSLPTPCHALRATFEPPSANARISVEIYSVSDPDRMCAQVIVPFNLILPLSGLSMDREYALNANGQDMLLFHWPLP